MGALTSCRNAQGTFDWSKPLDKRVYKGTYPTCHDFNHETVTPTSCALIVGFSAGQIQMIDPFQKEYPTSKLFNEERLIEKTSVTCLKWIPGQSQQFLVSHHSGFMYVYSEELPCVSTAPTYQLLKQASPCLFEFSPLVRPLRNSHDEKPTQPESRAPHQGGQGRRQPVRVRAWFRRAGRDGRAGECP